MTFYLLQPLIGGHFVTFDALESHLKGTFFPLEGHILSSDQTTVLFHESQKASLDHSKGSKRILQVLSPIFSPCFSLLLEIKPTNSLYSTS